MVTCWLFPTLTRILPPVSDCVRPAPPRFALRAAARSAEGARIRVCAYPFPKETDRVS